MVDFHKCCVTRVSGSRGSHLREQLILRIKIEMRLACFKEFEHNVCQPGAVE